MIATFDFTLDGGAGHGQGSILVRTLGSAGSNDGSDLAGEFQAAFGLEDSHEWRIRSLTVIGSD